MRSRTFLNVSLAILALAAAYHLGAANARAQGSGIVCAGIGDNGNTGVVLGRTLWVMHNPALGAAPFTGAPIPGVAAPVACAANGNIGYALLDDGTEWSAPPGGSWTLIATFPAAATSVRQESMGSVKVRYR
jgi:hypothetical protein